MKIFLLKRTDFSNYDTYDSCIVCAKTEDDAKKICPSGDVFKEGDECDGWVTSKDYISCKEIGVANEDQKRGVILASFNAG